MKTPIRINSYFETVDFNDLFLFGMPDDKNLTMKDMREIVHRVNYFDDLLEACKASMNEFKALGQALGELTPSEMVEVWNKVEAAIINAEKIL